MLKSIKSKIIIPVGVILAILVITMVVFVFISVSNLSDDLTDHRIQGAARAVAAQLEDFEEKSRIIAMTVAGDHVVISNLLDWNDHLDRPGNRQALIEHLNFLSGEYGVDSFVVRDFEGRIVLRLHDLETYYDIDGGAGGVTALAGTTNTAFNSTSTMPMMISTNTPIRHGGEIIGVLSGIFALDTPAFVDEFGEIFDARVSVFAGDTSVMTTSKAADGRRAIGGTLVPEVADIVMQGMEHFASISIAGVAYEAYYIPLIGAAGNPIGSIFFGFSNQYAVTATNTLTITLLIIGVAGLIIAVIIVLLIAGRISKPIASLAEWMKYTSSTGDIMLSEEDRKDIEIGSQRKDETGELYKYTAAFVTHIVDMVREVGTIAKGDLSRNVHLLSDKDTLGEALKTLLDNLNDMFGEVNNATAQVAAGSKQIADGSQALAQGSTEQSASVQQLSSSIAEIAQKTKDNASMAEKAAMLANDIKGSAEKGNRQMDEMMAAVKDINTSSHNISRVMKSIDDIAFQTNILALNAAVEAARAGQHGKGFAVVAEEVRNLAAKSADAAKDTESLIADSIEKAELGSKIADDTAESLIEIVAGIGESSQIVSEIAKSSEEQSENIEQINRGIDQVAQVVQQNSATAEQSAAASQEMSGQSIMLEELISRFKLKNANTVESLPPHRPL